MPHRTDVDRSITASRLARLLARLHPDAEQAAQEYERLRRTLVRFFDWRGALSPEEYADDTLDRLARKLEDTTVDDLRSYAHAVARLVLLERRRGQMFSSIEESPHLAIVPDAPSDNAGERLRDCFDLAGGAAHGYRIALGAGQFIAFSVDVERIVAAVTVIDPAGGQIEYGAAGDFSIVAYASHRIARSKIRFLR